MSASLTSGFVDAAFARALPKIELHAHLTGSITRGCLHEIWAERKASEPGLALDDPLVKLPEGGEGWRVETVFPLFTSYIYALISSRQDIHRSTLSVLQSFLADGVAYLELRTTPRTSQPNLPGQAIISKHEYISIILAIIADFNHQHLGIMRTNLILSIDRRNDVSEALEVVDLAIDLNAQAAKNGAEPSIVGIDLCGDPAKGDISIFRPAFFKAREHGLPLTLHFAEVPTSSTVAELDCLLSYTPKRLGHAIHVSEVLREKIVEKGIAVEICLSCNVLAGLSDGGFAGHHGQWWWKRGVNMVLCTDDVGIFNSTLSNEYRLAAHNWGLDRKELVDLAERAVDIIFGGQKEKERLFVLMGRFREEEGLVDTM